MRIAALLLGVALGLPTLAYADDDGSGPDASVLTRVDPPRDPRLAGMHELSAADIDAMKEPRLVGARVRCAVVDGMLLCLVPDGQRLALDGDGVGPGDFASGMEVGSIAIEKRPAGSAAVAPASAARQQR